MNYLPIKNQDKILRNVEVIKKNVNRLVLFWAPFKSEKIKHIKKIRFHFKQTKMIKTWLTSGLLGQKI